MALGRGSPWVYAHECVQVTVSLYRVHGVTGTALVPRTPSSSLLSIQKLALSERTKGLPHPDPSWGEASRGAKAGWEEVPWDPRRS